MSDKTHSMLREIRLWLVIILWHLGSKMSELVLDWGFFLTAFFLMHHLWMLWKEAEG